MLKCVTIFIIWQKGKGDKTMMLEVGNNKIKPYLDSEDLYYFISHEPNQETEGKQKKDYAGMGAALIFTFTVMSIVIGLSIYTAWQIAYGAEVLTHIVKNGYSFQYPPNWDLTERQNRFRPIDAYLRSEGNVIAFQRINSSYDAPDNDNALLQDMEYVIKSVYPDAYIYESGTDKYFINNQTAPS